MASTTNLRSTLWATSKLHRPATLTDSKLQLLVNTLQIIGKDLQDVHWRSCTSDLNVMQYPLDRSPSPA